MHGNSCHSADKSGHSGLAGIRVVIVEDDLVLNLDLEDIIAHLGCIVAGNASTFTRALELASDATCDVAILDINLNGERSDEAADVLLARGVPVVFTTGYNRQVLAARHRDCPVVTKPYTSSSLQKGIQAALEKKND